MTPRMVACAVRTDAALVVCWGGPRLSDGVECGAQRLAWLVGGVTT